MVMAQGQERAPTPSPGILAQPIDLVPRCNRNLTKIWKEVWWGLGLYFERKFIVYQFQKVCKYILIGFALAENDLHFPKSRQTPIFMLDVMAV